MDRQRRHEVNTDQQGRRRCFSTLSQCRSIHRSLTKATLIRLVVSLVLTRVDYCNAVLTGIPLTELNRLQAVINAAARLIFSGHQIRSDHVTPRRRFVTFCKIAPYRNSLTYLLTYLPLLVQLYLLLVSERIEYKLCVLVNRCLHDMAPEYLANACLTSRHGDIYVWQLHHN